MKSTTTIEQIKTTVYRLPLHEQLRWGKSSVMDEVRHVLVEVTLSDGAVGMAEAPPRPTIYGETVHTITGIIEQELKPRLVGKPAADLSRVHEIKNNHTAKGAIDTAVHDALAQSKGIPLAEHLGCTAERIKVSYILGIGEEDEVLAEAERVFAQGVRVLKVKVGRDWAADIRRIKTIRGMFGNEMDIYADANEGFTAENAAARLAELRELGVLYCEEPLPVELIQARARVRAEKLLPLIGDDSCFSVRDVRRELALDTFDILNIKTARTGYTESLEMLALAGTAGKGIMVGSQASSTLGAARAGLFAAVPGIDHPSELSFFLKLTEEIVAEPLVIQEGYVTVEDLLAVQVDKALLREAAVG